MKRLALVALLAVPVALLVGWVWGRAGTSRIDQAFQAAELRNDLLEARGSALSARVDLYSVNFGNASRNLENARDALRRAREHLRNAGQFDDAGRLEPALARIDEAQRLAGQLSQDANSRVAEAVKVLEDTLQTTTKR